MRGCLRNPPAWSLHLTAPLLVRRLEVLCDLYSTISVAQAIIFANLRRKIEWLYGQMEAQHRHSNAPDPRQRREAPWRNR